MFIQTNRDLQNKTEVIVKTNIPLSSQAWLFVINVSIYNDILDVASFFPRRTCSIQILIGVMLSTLLTISSSPNMSEDLGLFKKDFLLPAWENHAHWSNGAICKQQVVRSRTQKAIYLCSATFWMYAYWLRLWIVEYLALNKLIRVQSINWWHCRIFAAEPKIILSRLSPMQTT